MRRMRHTAFHACFCRRDGTIFAATDTRRPHTEQQCRHFHIPLLFEHIGNATNTDDEPFQLNYLLSGERHVTP